jgi:pSer/pThr/pTyr-binding forkhead associated (FHA) protein
MASLIVVSGQQRGGYLPLGRRTSVIGRGENLPLQILDDLVSRTHFRVVFDEALNRYYAEDMQSKHVTFFNARKLKEKSLLRENDCIIIGETTLLFTERDSIPRKAPSCTGRRSAREPRRPGWNKGVVGWRVGW